MEPIQTKNKRRLEAKFSQIKRIILGKGGNFGMGKKVGKVSKFLLPKTLILVITFLALLTSNQAKASSAMDISMFIMDKETNKPLDGDQTVSFIIYEGEDGSEVWSESQSVRVSYGLLKTSLGEDQDLPENLDPLNNDYYLGIKIGNDKELSPRKKISPNPFAISAISAQTLQGSKIGEEEGDIMLLGSGGKIDNDYLNTGEDDDNLILGNDDRLHNQNEDTGTTEKTFTIGSETSLGSNNFTLAVGSASSAPALRYNAGNDFWELSDNGTDYSRMVSKDYLGGVDSSIVPGSSGLSLGSLDNQWENLYVRNLVIGSTSIAGTAANYLTINDDAADGEDSGIKFYRGSTLDTHSIIQWDESEEYFSFYKNDTDLAGINAASVTATELTVNGAVTMGATGEDITAKSDIIPNESGMSLGSLANPWANVYTENFVIDTTSTTSEYFVINSDATDNQDSGLRFYRGPTLDTYATFHWDASETTLNFYQREDTTAFGTIKLNNLLVEGTVDGKDIATNAAMLNEAETINANWDNSANPWGDDEIVSTITRDSEWDTVAEIEAAISENLITASENNDDDVSGVELDDIFTSTGFLKRTGLATYTIDSIIDFSDETNATAGTGINITGDSISTTLGTAIDTTEITNGTVLATDLDSDTPANGEVLVYDSSTGGFQWTEPTGVGLTYYAAGTLLELAGTTFSIKEGTLTDEAICTYSSTEGLVCTTTIGEIDTDTYLSEDQVEAHIFDADNTGTLSSGTLALSSLSYTGTLPDTYLNSTITRDSEWDTISELETILSENLITASENNDDDVSGVELDDIFTSTGFLKRTGVATYTIDSIIDFSDETNASAGNDIDFSEDSILLEDDIDLSILRASASAGLSVYDDGGNLGLFVQDGGNVGVGTTSPGAKLDVDGSSCFRDRLDILQDGGDANDFLHLRDSTDSADLVFRYDGSDYQLRSELSGSGNLLMQIGLDGNIGLNTISGTAASLSIRAGTSEYIDFKSQNGGTPWMRIDDGNVGIGTTEPQTKLESRFNHTTSISNTNTLDRFPLLITNRQSPLQGTFTGIAFDVGTEVDIDSISAAIYVEKAGTDSSSNHAAKMKFATSQAGDDSNYVRMTIDNTGNVGIGTTAPSSKLDISGNARIYDQTATTGSTTLTIRAGAGQATSPLLQWQNNAGTGLGVIDESGNVGIGTGSPGYALDVVGFINTDSATGGYKMDGSTVLHANSTNVATLVGISAGESLLSDGYRNTALGYQALKTATSSDDNTAVGYQAGLNTSDGYANTFLGSFSGRDNSTGYRNTSLGYQAAINNTTGYENTNLGWYAGGSVVSGLRNTFIGVYAGRAAVSSSQYNTAIGSGAGDAVTGNNNTLLGYYAGATAGSGNVMLGYDAGRSETGSNKLYIENSSSTSPLVYGEFDNDILAINGDVGIGTTSPGAKLDVAGATTASAIQAKIANTTGSYKWEFANAGATTSRINLYGYDSSGNLDVAISPDGSSYFNGGNVGIGTTAPSSKLDISGNARIYDQTATTGSTTLTIRAGAGQATSPLLQWQNNAGTGLGIIDESGNVGIGTTSPLGKVHIQNSVAFDVNNTPAGQDGLLIRNTGASDGDGEYQSSIAFSRTASDARRAAIATVQTGSDNDQVGLAFFTHPSTTGDPIVEQMRIDSDGNVGIGTTSPRAKIHDEGTLLVTGVADNYLAEQTDIILGRYGRDDASNDRRNTISSRTSSLANGNFIKFNVDDGSSGNGNPLAVMTLLGNGNVGIGTTSPSVPLHVYGSSYPAGIKIERNDALDSAIDIANTEQTWRVGIDYSSSNSFAFSPTGALGGSVFNVTTDGNVGIGTEDPDEILHVYKSSSSLITTRLENPGSGGQRLYIQGGTGDAYAHFGISDDNWAIGIDNDDQNKFKISDATAPGSNNRLVIDTTGNVGIGTSSPQAKLNVRVSDDSASHTDSSTLLTLTGSDVLSLYNDSDTSNYSGLVMRTRSSGAALWGIFNEWQESYKGDLVFRGRDGGTTSKEVMRITSDGNVGIGTTSPETSLHVMDGIKQEVSSDPTLEGSLIDSTNMDNAYAVAVSGKYAYVASYNSDSLSVIDISDPSNPTLEGSLIDSTNMNEARGVYVSGDYAYVIGYNSDSLAIIDISDPTNPTLVGSLVDVTDMNGPMSVYVSGKYAYIARVSDALTIVDISDPTGPTITGELIDATNIDAARGVYVSGKYAYTIGYNSHSLAVIDISDPSDPTLEGSLIDATNMNNPVSVYVSGKYAYVTGITSDSLAVIDISDPSDPTLEGSLIDSTNMDYPSYVYVSGKYAYVAGLNSDSLAIIDISDPSDPTIVSKLVDSTNMNGVRGVYVSGKYAYAVGSEADSLAVIDINGAEFSSVFAGNIETGSMNILDDVSIGGQLNLRGNLQASNGLFRDGLSVADSFIVNEDGYVGIGTTTPTNTLQVDNEKGVYFYDGSKDFLTSDSPWSIRNYTQITDGNTTEANDYRHFWNDLWIDDSSLTTGHIYGIYNYVTLTDGTIGDDESMYGSWSGTRINGGEITSNLIADQINADANAGTIGNDMYGLNLTLDVEPEVTSIGGNVYGQRIWMDVDKDPTGSAYGLFMDIRTNVDYAVYQTGDVPNYFRGDVGIATLPSVALDVNGSIEYTGTITDVSDSRLKENMIPLENSLEKITQLQAISFNMIDDEEERTELGFTAQNVQEFFPEAVSTIDAEGHLGLAYDQLIAPTIHSIQTINSVVNVTDAPTNSPSIYIDENQNVGIGDISPSYILTVDHNGDGTNVAYVNDSNAWTSGSADYAEYYKTTDKDLEAGEAVCIDIKEENTVERCSRDGDSNIMGIVSTNPAFLGNAPAEERREDNNNYTVVAMLGQVPAKVSTENGEINPGDSLSAAETSGYLKKANPGESTVGVALEQLSINPSSQSSAEASNEGIGFATINVLISRKNKSLTVSEIEDKVTERVASMEIEDEVDLLVQDAINNLDIEDLLATFDERILTLEEEQTEDWIPAFAEMTEELESQNTYLEELTETIESTNDLVDYLTQKTLSRETRIQVLEDQVAILADLADLDNPELFSSGQSIEFASLLEKENSTVLGVLATNLSYEVDGEKFVFNLDGELEVSKIKAEKGEFEEVKVAGESSGRSIIEAGETEILVESKAVDDDCKIIITAKGNNYNKNLYYDNVLEGESFKVKFYGESLEEDLSFDWVIIK